MRYLLFILMFVCSTVLAITYNPYGSSGLNTSYSGNYDDGSVAVSLPWSVSFLGTSYSTAYVGTNGYVTFGSGNSTYYNFSASNPSQPHISVYPGDRRLYTLYTGEVNGGTSSAYFVIRVEGVDYSNAAITHVYEIHFYANQSYFDVIFVDAPSSGNQNGGTSGVSDGTTYESTFTVTEGTAIRLNLSDGSEVAGGTSTTTGTSGGITSAQSTSKSQARTRSNNQSDNTVYIDQVGDNNTVIIEQDGTATNTIRGIYSSGDDAGLIQGNSNTIEIRQGADTSTSSNLIEFKIIGSTNDILLYQDRLNNGYEDTLAGGGHNIILDVYGSSNDIDLIQRNNYDTYGGHHINLEVDGSSNTINMKQISDYSKDIFGKVTGNNNSVDVYQEGDANKYLDFDLTGNGHTIDVDQLGTGAHNAEITLIYGSAPSTVNLLQQGSTDQSYSIEQTCYTAGGCSTTVTQGN